MAKKKKYISHLKYPLEIVEWIDAESECHWIDFKEAEEWKKQKMVALEIGWVIEDSKELLVLTSQLAADGDIGNRTKIPKPWIVSRRKVRVL